VGIEWALSGHWVGIEWALSGHWVGDHRGDLFGSTQNFEFGRSGQM